MGLDRLAGVAGAGLGTLRRDRWPSDSARLRGPRRTRAAPRGPGALSLSLAAALKVSPRMMSPWRSPARKSMVSSRSQTGALPSRSMSARRVIRRSSSASRAAGGGRRAAAGALRARRRGEAPLDGGHQLIADRGAALLVDLADASRARHVDLGHESTDHIEADEQHPPRRERRADLAREPAVTLIERPGDPARSRGEIAAVVPARGDARERVRHRLAIDQQHP